MFPLIFLSLCVQFYQHSSILRTTCMKCVQKSLLKGKCMCAPSFLKCAHLTTCVCTYWHSLDLEGTLAKTMNLELTSSPFQIVTFRPVFMLCPLLLKLYRCP